MSDAALDWSEAPCLTLAAQPSELQRILSAAAALVLKHPEVMQDVFAALIAEGRQFAQTDDGRRWRAALAGSDLIRHGRALWESSALNILEDAPGVVVPSAIIDAVVRSLSDPTFHEHLADATADE